MATFCLLHGKWHDSSCWDPVVRLLRAAGHEVAAPELPIEDPRTTHADRAAPALEALGAASPPVVVVGHSLAAAYAPLVAVDVPGSMLVYLCPAPTGPFGRAGAPMSSTQPGFAFPPDRADGTSAWDPAAAIAQIYPRLPAERAQVLAACLKPGAAPADRYPLDGSPGVPTAFICAAHDEFFAAEWSSWIAREIVGVEPIVLDTGHFPMVEAPELVAETLLGLEPILA